MTRYLNNPYFKEIKQNIKDYMIKLNLEYIKYKDLEHMVNKSDFIRLCKSGFFVKYHFKGSHGNLSWALCESEKPRYTSSKLNFER